MVLGEPEVAQRLRCLPEDLRLFRLDQEPLGIAVYAAWLHLCEHQCKASSGTLHLDQPAATDRVARNLGFKPLRRSQVTGGNRGIEPLKQVGAIGPYVRCTGEPNGDNYWCDPKQA